MNLEYALTNDSEPEIGILETNCGASPTIPVLLSIGQVNAN